jgi:hypothetical protein
MTLLALALAALLLFWITRLRVRPVKQCRRCAGVGCSRCDGSGVRMRRGLGLAHKRRISE